MKFKKIIIGLALVLATSSVLAYLTREFSDWHSLKISSPYIIIARCTASAEKIRMVDGYHINDPFPTGRLGGGAFYDMEVAVTLKGSVLKPNLPIILFSQYQPIYNEYCLLFVTSMNTTSLDETNCDAFDLYRVVSLGQQFSTNMLVGKTNLDEQIKALLQYRLNNLNQEMKQAEAEKKRLEEGLKD